MTADTLKGETMVAACFLAVRIMRILLTGLPMFAKLRNNKNCDISRR